ncbi:hypothetical protein Tco_1015268 [Tanacetum coccineum]|uniref:Chromo domain-containing protein n=1 Tax=Tanacetum coccineum TaxID=301880 RepID=A0ABQ5FLF1_9ASTR
MGRDLLYGDGADEKGEKFVWTDEPSWRVLRKVETEIGVCSILTSSTERLDVELCVRGSGGFWASMRIESNLMLQIKEAQRDDGELWAIMQNVEDGKHTEFLCGTGDRFSMDFPLLGFAYYSEKLHDAIWVVIIVGLTKSAPFLTHSNEHMVLVTLAENFFNRKLLDLHVTPDYLLCPTRSEFYVSFLERITESFGELVLKFSTTIQSSNRSFGMLASKVSELSRLLIEKRIVYAKEKLKEARSLQIQPDMSLSEEPESIMDRQERVMRNKVIPFVKILWKNHPEREATWETEESMRASYPHFFVQSRGSDFDTLVVFSLSIALLRNKPFILAFLYDLLLCSLLNPAMQPLIFEPLIFEPLIFEPLALNLCYDPFEMNFDMTLL